MIHDGASSGPSPLYDSGLQPERTALAWRRTGLALAAGALAGLRILPKSLGTWALAPAIVGVALSLTIVALAHTRYRDHHRRLTSTNASSGHPALAGGGLPALLAATATFAGIASLFVTVAQAVA